MSKYRIAVKPPYYDDEWCSAHFLKQYGSGSDGRSRGFASKQDFLNAVDVQLTDWKRRASRAPHGFEPTKQNLELDYHPDYASAVSKAELFGSVTLTAFGKSTVRFEEIPWHEQQDEYDQYVVPLLDSPGDLALKLQTTYCGTERRTWIAGTTRGTLVATGDTAYLLGTASDLQWTRLIRVLGGIGSAYDEPSTARLVSLDTTPLTAHHCGSQPHSAAD